MMATGSAFAASYSNLTLGVGTAVGVNHTSAFQSSATASFNSEFNLKLKALRILGFEMSYAPTEKPLGDDDLVFDGRLRMSVLIYVVPTRVVSGFLKFGVGANNVKDLVKPVGATSSYHAGFGLEVEVGDNFVIGGEFLFLAPGIGSVKNAIEAYANDEIDKLQNPARAGEVPAKELELKDFVSASNFRVALGAKYFF
jgi:hypothetical protein